MAKCDSCHMWYHRHCMDIPCEVFGESEVHWECMQPPSCPSARGRESCASSAERPITPRPNAHSHPFSSSSGTIPSPCHPTRHLRKQQGDVWPDPRHWSAFAHHGTRGAVPSQAHAGSDMCVPLAGAKAIGRKTARKHLPTHCTRCQGRPNLQTRPTQRTSDTEVSRRGHAVMHWAPLPQFLSFSC